MQPVSCLCSLSPEGPKTVNEIQTSWFGERWGWKLNGGLSERFWKRKTGSRQCRVCSDYFNTLSVDFRADRGQRKPSFGICVLRDTALSSSHACKDPSPRVVFAAFLCLLLLIRMESHSQFMCWRGGPSLWSSTQVLLWQQELGLLCHFPNICFLFALWTYILVMILKRHTLAFQLLVLDFKMHLKCIMERKVYSVFLQFSAFH